VLEFFKFFSWTAIWAYVLSDAYTKLILPLIGRFYRNLDELAESGDLKLEHLQEKIDTNPDDVKNKYLYEMAKAKSTDYSKTKHYFMKAIALTIEIIFIMCLTYALVSWSAWCVLRCVMYTQGMETYRWVYFVPGFLCCELALGKASNAAPYRNLLGLIPYVMGMGAFVVFSLNYEPIRTSFAWMIKFVGLESL
jgi:hypothetical protein